MTETFENIGSGVRARGAEFAGKDCHRSDAEHASPQAFASLTKAGYLETLIPGEYGGSGLGLPAAVAILEEIAAALLATSAGDACTAELSMAKRRTGDAPWPAAMCLQTHGGFGVACEHDVEPRFGEPRLHQVAPISTNLILADLAEHVLDLPRSH